MAALFYVSSWRLGGQTPGMKAWRIRVTGPDGVQIDTIARRRGSLSDRAGEIARDDRGRGEGMDPMRNVGLDRRLHGRGDASKCGWTISMDRIGGSIQAKNPIE